MEEPPGDGPGTTAVRRRWETLGLPGLIDVHVHFMPERVMAKVWSYFDRAGPLIGRPWPIRYRLGEAERLQLLREWGVRAFPSLVYPHRPGMAVWLNGWAGEFATRVPECLRTATFFPEESAGAYVGAAIAGGARVFKAHVQVGGYDPRDPLLDPVWGQLADARVPVLAHVGSGPVAGEFTGPGPIAEVLRRHPRLVLIVAHLGYPEPLAFADLALAHDAVYLDTTMAFVDFWGPQAGTAGLLSRLVALEQRIVFGSDFPNIPHDYVHQLEVLERLDLDERWYRAVYYENAARLFGLPPAAG